MEASSEQGGAQTLFSVAGTPGAGKSDSSQAVTPASDRESKALSSASSTNVGSMCSLAVAASHALLASLRIDTQVYKCMEIIVARIGKERRKRGSLYNPVQSYKCYATLRNHGYIVR